MNYIKRRYFETLKEDPDAIWQYLDCMEKIAYHQFQDSPLVMEEVFCDDINICLYEGFNDLKLVRNCIKRPNHYYDRVWKQGIQNPNDYIKEMIDSGMIVGINTHFYDIPNFTWYKRERYRESIHVCMVVGYDENGFWLTDVPGLMKAEYLKNQHITIISYNDMSQYLAKQCNILTFREKSTTFSICEDLGILINKIVQEYYMPPNEQKGKTVWRGREAFERLLYLIEKKDPRLLEMDFYHGEYISFIIGGRHDLLRRNIIKKYEKNRLTEDTLKALEICQKKWEVLGYKIARENIKKGIYTPIIDDIYDIYEAEKELIKSLELLALKPVINEMLRKSSGVQVF